MMQQFQLLTKSAYKGVDASIPSIKECDSWGETEDEAIANVIERLGFFLQLQAGFKFKLDLSRKEDGNTYYTLILR